MIDTETTTEHYPCLTGMRHGFNGQPGADRGESRNGRPRCTHCGLVVDVTPSVWRPSLAGMRTITKRDREYYAEHPVTVTAPTMGKQSTVANLSGTMFLAGARDSATVAKWHAKLEAGGFTLLDRDSVTLTVAPCTERAA